MRLVAFVLSTLVSYSNLFFGRGDDDFPLWLLTIRANVLLLLGAWVVILGWQVARARWRNVWRARSDVGVVVALTTLAAALRIWVPSNPLDHGGIAYSRILVGYRGYFATAQFFSLFYEATARDIEHAILLDRIVSTATVPLAYLLCRSLAPSRVFAAVTGLLVAVYPLNVLLAASDALAVFSGFLLAGDAGDHAARVYANWIIPILVVAGYGFAVLLTEAGWLGKAVGGVCVLWLAVQPLVFQERLSTQYLEILEHDAFRSLWRTLPSDTRWVIVPDDELMSRTTHSTLETYTKYAMIRAAVGAGAETARLVGITTFLEHPEAIDCAQGACVFFFGLPCSEPDLYPQARDQCAQLLKQRGATLVGATEVVAAPFRRCSIYGGTLWASECAPAIGVRQFALYRLR